MQANQRYTCWRRIGLWLALVGLTSLMLGCASPKNRAPVENRGAVIRKPVLIASGVARPSGDTRLPGAENAGKPGYYTVRPGDTLIRVGLESGQNWKDLVEWNNIDNPNVIEVGRVLRVVPPEAASDVIATPQPVQSAQIETRPLGPPTTASGSNVAVPGAAATAGASDEDLNWMWPANGPVVKPFDETSSKGLAIGGRAGDPVLAAADGRVVYAGSGLRGYGNLLIIKHNSTYLTAYAHNQSLLVKEDQVVQHGQKIAEMGSTDAERVQLHFEIRKLGKPIDPATLLPPR